MKVLGIIVGLLLVLALLLLFALKPRYGEKKLTVLRKFRYAHRGLHNAKQGIPENSLLAFRYALAGGFGAELDVHLTKDKRLVVIHDSDLMRVCGVEGKVEEKNLSELRQLRLQETNERIPLLEEVLPLFCGKTPLIIELKTAGGNCRELCYKVCQMLESYQGEYCLESFDPRVLWWLRRNEPFIIRGQLVENFMKQSEVGGLNKPMCVLLTSLLANLLTRPDFIACRYADRNMISARICREVLKAPEVSWTLRSQEELADAEKNGAIVIFEGFLPEKRKKKKKAAEQETAAAKDKTE